MITSHLQGRTGSFVVGLLLLVHIGLATWFASITPYRTSGVLRSYGRSPAQDIGAPDERQHVNYIYHLASGQGFPVFNPKDPNLYETYQSHQPPAFYVLEAAWSKIVGFNSQESPVGIRLRYLNVIIGALGVLGTFYLGKWGLGREDVGVIAAAFTALLPMNVALSGAVSNDPMLIALCTWTLALIGMVLRNGWSVKLAAVIGATIGVAILTKTTAIALVPVTLVACMIRKPALKEFLAATGIILILITPWWVRNQTHYGDPLAMKAFSEAFVGSAQASGFIEQYGLLIYLLNWVGWYAARSFFGSFGYMDIWLNETGRANSDTPNSIYRLFLAVMVIGYLGWIASVVKQTDKSSKSFQLLSGIFLVTVFVLFLKFNLQYFQGQARYILPAIGPIAIGFASGILYLLKDRWSAALALTALLFGGLSIYSGTILPDRFAERISYQTTAIQ